MEEKDNKNVTQGKGKGKNKKQTMNLNEFVNAGATQTGFTAVPTMRWSDVMDGDDEDLNEFGSKKDSVVMLPNAPKSHRGPNINVDEVPTQPPFICHLSNLPFEASESDVSKFFRDLSSKIVHIDLSRDPGSSNRSRGQGSCEFVDRQSLIDAFAFDQETLKNRPIKISLRSYEQERESFRRDRDYGRSDGGEDRTAGDWRSGKPDLKPMGGGFAPMRYDDANKNSYNRNRNYGRSDYNNDNSSMPYGGDSNNYSRDGRSDYNSYNRQSNRSDRNNYNNSMNNSYSNQQFDSNPNRGEFSRDYMSKSIEPREPSGEEKVRPRIILDKPTRPRPEQQPPLIPPPQLSDIQSNPRSESESSETARKVLEPERPVERKRLVLLPPSKKENTNPSEAPRANPSIFGDAKPVDTTKRLLEIESKVLEHDKEIEKELSEKLEKQPISESNDGEHREPRGSRDFNKHRLSDSGSQSGDANPANRSDRPHYRDNDRNRFDDGGYRKTGGGGGGNRRINQQPSGHRNYENNYNNQNRYNRDDHYREQRSDKYNNAGNRNMSNQHDQMNDNRRQDYDDQRSNRMVGNNNSSNNNRGRQNQQENFQQINKFSLLNEEMD